MDNPQNSPSRYNDDIPPVQPVNEFIPGLTVLNDIREYWANVTCDQIESAQRQLTKSKVGDLHVIGTVTAKVTRTLYAIFRHLDLQSDLETTKSRLAADETAEKTYLERAAVLTIFSELARALFWAQVKMDLGFHENVNIGIREGWVVVRQKENSPEQMLMTKLGIVAPEE